MNGCYAGGKKAVLTIFSPEFEEQVRKHEEAKEAEKRRLEPFENLFRHDEPPNLLPLLSEMLEACQKSEAPKLTRQLAELLKTRPDIAEALRRLDEARKSEDEPVPPSSPFDGLLTIRL